MTRRISFSNNPNGKLFSDTFSDVRLADAERFYAGSKLDVYLKGMQMGTVQVVAIRPILYKQITDVLSYLVCGKPAAYLAAMIRNWYEPQDDITGETRLAHLVLQWTSRNVEAHALQLQEWWQATRSAEELKPQTQTQNSNT
ncbi:MAG TPA: hypothetical protein VEB42_02930 [Chitinophagaceae bacterium]|nr:hypothetical protein [Chitinophagaceae bacterium]